MGRRRQTPELTRAQDVPDRYVVLVRDMLLKRFGYRLEVCPEAVKTNFEDLARTACAIIIDEERERHAQAQKD